MGWTTAQQQVIDTRNKNLLVSAAAGSGKTAVLVERIISMISQGDQPLDIDHLLVVTFTNAAAAEMRTRIGKALEEKLINAPDNLHLQKQISLLQSAQITTIHSFCLNVIRNYFHRIDLDPSFKIAEESEITLMKSDVIAELLERWYEKGEERFHTFIECYSYSKSDAPVEDLILQLYNFSMSAPWPRLWLEEKQKNFELVSLEEMNSAPWMKELLDYIRAVLGDLLNKNAKALDLCNAADGPSAYAPALVSDRDLILQLKKASAYDEYHQLLSTLSFARLSSKKEEGVDPAKKELVKSIREEVKKGLKDLLAQFFFQAPEEMLQDLQAVSEVMKVLFELTLDFMDEFAAKKEEKNLIDFNDLEHFALKILVENQEGERVPSQAAIELSELFDEILIDEYQDSNMVQETILKSISRERLGRPNRFMVGDVKQSIYKFRLAMPEIFMEKYNRYSTCAKENGDINYEQRIDLDKNFRSRKVVLDFVNDIFEQIMTEAVGGIFYDEAAALKYGGLFDTAEGTENSISPSRISSNVELLLVTEEELAKEEESEMEYSGNLRTEESTEEISSKELNKGSDEELDEVNYTKKELEARAIAKRIKELTDPDTGLMLYDNKEKKYRPAGKRDIVILLRSMSNWAEVFVNTLMQEGIPAYADTGTGYFQTLEIRTILNLLKIIDNPRQDIPFTGVLYSPMVGLSTTELSLIRTFHKSSGMYIAAALYAKEGEDEELRLKLGQFLTMLEEFRKLVIHTPIHELLQEVLDRTGYTYYVMAMPGGERRKGNIDMLISQAERFEKGSYSGLFHFIRYIEKLHKYEVDFGEAQATGEQDDTVRVMSIHKSKGLEFPIVFVAGMSKQFNNQDIRNSIVLHAGIGVGPEYVDTKTRTKVPTLLKKAIQKKVQLENMGEELRVLYVAMTRAKEKLILSGYLNSVDEIKKKDFSFFEIASAKSYLELVLPAVINRVGTDYDDISKDYVTLNKDKFSLTVLTKEVLLQEEIKKQIFLEQDEEELLGIDLEETYNSDLKEEIKTRFNYRYPYEKDAGLKVKMTVSELKKLGQFVDEEQSEKLYDKPITLQEDKQEASGEKQILGRTGTLLTDVEFNPTIPDFISQKEKEISGTDQGSMYHRVLELLNLPKVHSREDLLHDIQEMINQNKIHAEAVEKLKLDYIFGFMNSNVAQRMRRAQEQGKLFKERQFVMGLKANEVLNDYDSQELILIQGIIDVYFEEEDELVLLDYKSDVVKNEVALIDRYQVQLHYYKKALEQMLKKKVKEMLIYSLYLNKEIRIK